MGFEALDILKGIKRLFEKIKENDYKVEIEYIRAVNKKGNKEALKALNSVFEVKDSDWRGIGVIKKSGLKLKNKYKEFDAEKKFKVKLPKIQFKKNCICGEVLQGAKSPSDCKLFGKTCIPRKPFGPCMVSSEGTCAAYYKYGEK